MSTNEEDVPPTYEEAVAPPPSYQSLYGEIKDVRRHSDNFAEFLVKICFFFANTIGFAVLLGFLLAIPITMIVIGAKYKDDCPGEDKIPIYLIVAGAVLIVRNLSSMCSRASERNEDEDNSENEKNPMRKCCDSILDLFIFCWFITGNYWIYHINKPSFNKSDDDYCNKTLYLFAFWITTCTYIIAGFLCCCLCCFGICVAANSDDD
ncbi:uncharacterized protein LOC114524503 [Dendronephthya gigantea]|uniref:uncharacterized protein LOC114524503 n=1 Tax=Dendronephthya gigantea TaxID=151771 RepID=UPI00106D0BB4|nr:uncharacterized protein LOC114524503 [Dendronephthya gigantea]